MECPKRRDFGEPRGAQPGCVIREQRRLDLGRVVLGEVWPRRPGSLLASGLLYFFW